MSERHTVAIPMPHGPPTYHTPECHYGDQGNGCSCGGIPTAQPPSIEEIAKEVADWHNNPGMSFWLQVYLAATERAGFRIIRAKEGT